MPRLIQLMDPPVQHKFVDQLAQLTASKKTPVHHELHGLAVAHSAAVTQADDSLFGSDLATDTHMPGASSTASYVKAIAAYELARYREANENFLRVQASAPNELIVNHDYLKAAFGAGKLVDKDRAKEFFARQFIDMAVPSVDQGGATWSRMLRSITHDVIATLSPHIADAAQSKSGVRIGVFFLSSTEALGHAILDPFHFLALHRNDYDRIFFIGPHPASYRPASRVCLEIVGQYGTYIPTESDPLLNLSWMSLGSFDVGPISFIIQPQRGHDAKAGVSWYGPRTRRVHEIELVVEHYWSLLRDVVHRSTDAEDLFHHNRWHMALPDAFQSCGHEFCADNGIDMNRPIVVLHARDRRYHEIGKQSYRDAKIENYLPAIEELLERGMTVIRIGDDKMTKLPVKSPQYHELPYMAGYDHRLDPFFIARAKFMIGCQSGPCAYARAFGVPLLSVNAVLHYTLLPSTMEMACFKRFFRLDDDGKPLTELSLEEALAVGVARFDNSHQYEIAKIDLVDATAPDITAAVVDMLAWLERPDLAPTEAQQDFSRVVERHAAALRDVANELDLPIADYLGVSLPGYRISPSVAGMRASSSTHRRDQSHAAE